jgi:hypothetical protein
MSRLNKSKKMLHLTTVASAVALLASCAATQVAMEHHHLDVSTKQSETIFLDPVSASQKTVFLSVKNTSDQALDITPQLRTALINHGYRVVKDAGHAHYLVQANILQIGKMSVAASQTALGGGYGSAVAGGIAGAAAGSFTHQTSGIIAGGIAGGVIGLAADSLVKAVNYTMITDIQISERVGRGVKVHEQFNAALQNGSASTSSQTYSTSSEYQRFRTRVVSNADKVNLKFETARPLLEQGLTKAISGIF